ncbi:MAG: 4-hydroxy-3-methylbut-2-enyl diphosphate reductase [Clostridia bacterium]|nr:4-hydroxy-3-methylbut-2-enyl diphosphate reductase [Clostridia bacterium]
MELIVGKLAGFCAGVRNAVNKTEKELENEGEIFCLGELTHNSVVMNKLISNGLKVVDKIEDGKEKVIIRAHGVKKEIYEKAQKLGINLVDLTCPKVLKIHEEAQRYSLNNYFIFLIAESTHPETIGTYSFCGDNKYIIEKVEDVNKAIENFEKSNLKDILVISQTTFSVEKFNNIVDKLEKEIDKSKVNIVINKSICNATSLRQEEAEIISKQVDLMIVIGGKNSSNTKKLFEIACKNSKKAILIERKDELINEDFSSYQKIGITAGASTPKKSIEEVIKLLEVL